MCIYSGMDRMHTPPVSRFTFIIIIILIIAIAASCGRTPAETTTAARRIVSLSPSLSRMLADLEAAEMLAGVTSFDDFRDRAQVVGSMVRPNAELILSINPDLVIFSEDDGSVQAVDSLSSAGLRVRRFPKTRSFDDIIANYLTLASIISRDKPAVKKIEGYRARRSAEVARPRSSHRPRVAFLVSVKPLIAASDESYIGAIIRDAGGECAVRSVAALFPILSLESLVAAHPEIIIVMSEQEADWESCRRILAPFPNLARRVRGITPSHVAYYTPSDYIQSVNEIRALIEPLSGQGGRSSINR